MKLHIFMQGVSWAINLALATSHQRESLHLELLHVFADRDGRNNNRFLI